MGGCCTIPGLLSGSSMLADLYVPSFVELLTGPVLWAPFVLLVGSIPIIAAIGFIEALVLRRYAPGERLRSLTLSLGALNAGTSLIGTFFTWPGTSLWPGLLLAYIVTVPLEALLLRWKGVIKGLPGGQPFRAYFRMSTEMNAASYAALAIALTAMIYLPNIQHDDKRLASELHGTLVFSTDQATLKRIKLGSGRIQERGQLFGERANQDDPLSRPLDWMIPAESGGLLLTFRYNSTFKSHLQHVSVSDRSWQHESLDLTGFPCWVLGISSDANTLLAAVAEQQSGNQDTVVMDAHTGQILRHLPNLAEEGGWGIFSHDKRFVAYGPSRRGGWPPVIKAIVDLKTGATKTVDWDHVAAAFSPTSDILAWANRDRDEIQLYDCLTGKQQKLPIPGSVWAFWGIAWSPDGKYLAYVGSVNPFMESKFYTDLRVTRADGSASTTVYRGYGSSRGDAVGHLVWVR